MFIQGKKKKGLQTVHNLWLVKKTDDDCSNYFSLNHTSNVKLGKKIFYYNEVEKKIDMYSMHHTKLKRNLKKENIIYHMTSNNLVLLDFVFPYYMIASKESF